jgi:2-polyprenyl-3-methyl-5-hydroxy-6-metoxy-1,4-benzoquinol methylase
VKDSHHNNSPRSEAFSSVFDGSPRVAADQHHRMPEQDSHHPGQINYSVDLLRRDEAERRHITDELRLIREEYGINGCTLLEVGCGLGQNLEIFRTSNKVLGIEGLASAVSEACSRGLAVIKGDLQSPLDIVSGSIDWLLCLDVLEHLERPLSLMLEMRRVLRVRGRAILNVPNHFDLSGRLKLLMGHNLDVHKFFPESDDWDNPHLRFFSHAGIKRMVAASGFQLLHDRSGHFCSFPKRRLFEAAGLNPVLRYLAEKKPSLFAGGFFLIIEKTAVANGSER